MTSLNQYESLTALPSLYLIANLYTLAAYAYIALI